MGRFSHEAVMVDPRTGYVYQTEDSGRLRVLQVRALSARPLRRGREALHARGSEAAQSQSRRVSSDRDALGRAVGAESTIPLRPRQRTFAQGAAKGARGFSRLEGAWWGDKTGFFLSTNGGSVGRGTGLRVRPARGNAHSSSTMLRTRPTWTIPTTSPSRRAAACCCARTRPATIHRGRAPGRPDARRQDVHVRHEQHRPDDCLQQPEFRPATTRQNEWAGACYSPDGRWLFVNIQTPGVTFAITGPWGKGPL